MNKPANKQQSQNKPAQKNGPQTRSSRTIAAEALLQVELRGAWSSFTLDNIVRRYNLPPRSVGLVAALLYGVIERKITLDAGISALVQRSTKHTDPVVISVLRLGIYELLYMNNAPDAVIVNESVKAVQALGRAEASNFVNAILHSFINNDKRILLPKGTTEEYIAVKYSCPPEWVSSLLIAYGEEPTTRFLAGSIGRAPLYLRVNTLKTTPEELVERLEESEVRASVDPDIKNCIIAENTRTIPKLAEYWEGLFHVQDKSSQFCAEALRVEPGMRVLDTCSAPGGKTFTLSEIMENTGEIIAVDVNPERVKMMGKRAKQLGITIVKPLVASMAKDLPDLGEFDRVLCDAPCSGFGVIRRKPEIKYKIPTEIVKLPYLQIRLLENAATYCKIGGLLLYSTCTLNPGENSGVSDRFLELHPEFSPEPLPEILGGTPSRTLIDNFGADGFYLSLFRRMS